MGCNCSNENSLSKVYLLCNNQKRDVIKRSNYLIKLYSPNSLESNDLIIEEIKENILVSELINMVCFNSKHMTELDANFICLYNKDTDEFDFYIQRLHGYEMNETMSWVLYINNKRENWTDICRNNRIVIKNDEIEFRYELKVPEKNNLFQGKYQFSII